MILYDIFRHSTGILHSSHLLYFSPSPLSNYGFLYFPYIWFVEYNFLGCSFGGISFSFNYFVDSFAGYISLGWVS